MGDPNEPREPEDRYFDQVQDFLNSPAGKVALMESAKEACAHVLLRLGIRANEPEEVVKFQADVAHLRDSRLSAALQSHRLLELQLWQQHHDRTCVTLKKAEKETLERIEQRIAAGETARRWIRRRMDAFIVVLIGGMATLIWYLLTHEVVVVVRQ